MKTVFGIITSKTPDESALLEAGFAYSVQPEGVIETGPLKGQPKPGMGFGGNYNVEVNERVVVTQADDGRVVNLKSAEPAPTGL